VLTIRLMSPPSSPGRMIFGHWLEYNVEAAEDAHHRIRAFLVDHLSK
jgi:hypothetical protein